MILLVLRSMPTMETFTYKTELFKMALQHSLGDLGPYLPSVVQNGSSRSASLNFGQRGSFVHTPPTGYKSLCTTNLPDPAIADGSTAFDIKTFTANNGSHL